MNEADIEGIIATMSAAVVARFLKEDASDGRPQPKTHAEKAARQEEKEETEMLIRGGLELFGGFLKNQARVARALEILAKMEIRKFKLAGHSSLLPTVLDTGTPYKDA